MIFATERIAYLVAIFGVISAVLFLFGYVLSAFVHRHSLPSFFGPSFLLRNAAIVHLHLMPTAFSEAFFPGLQVAAWVSHVGVRGCERWKRYQAAHKRERCCVAVLHWRDCSAFGVVCNGI
jgi:hypothetical protein